MSIRVTVLALVVAFLAIYAWKDWFRSLCGLILLMAVIEHEDMPRSIRGVQGLNPWNVLMLSIVLAWAVSRHKEGLKWDMPQHVTGILLAVLAFLLLGVLRACLDRENLRGYPVTALLSEELVNSLKWVIPGLLLFDGCRSRRRLDLAMWCLLGMFFLISLQVAKRIPPLSVLEHGEAVHRMRLKLCKSIGYSSVEMSTMLAGAAWAMVVALPLLRERWKKGALVAAAGVTSYATALTGGRAGYLAWVVVGLVLCLLRWRKWLLVAPVLVVVACLLFPGAVDRALSGFGEVSAAGEETVDTYEALSGRFLAWPLVVDKISEAPVLGYGRLAMVRTGLRDHLWETLGESFPHPHNAYLEWVFDNGFIGMVSLMALFGVVLVWAGSLFCDKHHPECAVVGGVCLALVLAQLAGGIGSQHFYPTETTLGMWASVFLACRLWVTRSRVSEVRAVTAYPSRVYAPSAYQIQPTG